MPEVNLSMEYLFQHWLKVNWVICFFVLNINFHLLTSICATLYCIKPIASDSQMLVFMTCKL